jgi:hypothetical protein
MYENFNNLLALSWSYVYVLFLLYLCPYTRHVQQWSRGKSGRLVVKGPWFESPLEQFLLKTRAVNSVLGNRNMIGKIPTWCENSVHGNRKTARKNSSRYGGKFPSVGEKKSSVAWII